jgi:hypothetical protein
MYYSCETTFHALNYYPIFSVVEECAENEKNNNKLKSSGSSAIYLLRYRVVLVL